MNIGLQKKCSLFVENRNIIKEIFKWDGDLTALAGSSLFTFSDVTVNKEKLIQCNEILKHHFGSLSEFRGNAKIPLICQMAIMDNPESYLLSVKKTYELLNKSKVFGSDSKLISAITISSHIAITDIEKYIDRTYEIYNNMKENHKWLTSVNDLPFAAMLAVSDMDVDKLSIDMENCYNLLKDKFEKNAAQSLSHVLALCDGDADKKCNKVCEIFDGLKIAKHSYGANYELASLGTISSLNVSNEQLIKEICEVDDYLKSQKGFGSLSISSYSRRMYASLIVMNSHQKAQTNNQIAVINNILSMSLSMEACMIIILLSK